MLLLIADLMGLAAWYFLKVRFNVKYELLIVFILTIAMLCYGYIDAKNIRTIQIDILTDKLPADIDRIRIVQISDLHIGRNYDVNQLVSTLKITGMAGPDLIVLTGDTVDMDMRNDEYFHRILSTMKAPLGKFAVTGNHEHYAGMKQAVEFMERAGYTVLRSDWRDLGPIVIAGIDDPGRVVVSRQNDGLELLQSIPENLRNKFILFLRHQPNVPEDIIGLFDLKLSGHTHAGQVWPFRYVVSFVYGVKQGLSVFGDSFLYVSNGTGYWGPPIRFLAPPEVTIIDVIRK
jgi:predicted MPP superfamily phosphohydrolase